MQPGLTAGLIPRRRLPAVAVGTRSHVGSFASSAAADAAYAAARWTKRTGDTFTRSSDDTLWRWSGFAWELEAVLSWDGETPGERLSDLPTSGVYTGATASVGQRRLTWTGSTWSDVAPLLDRVTALAGMVDYAATATVSGSLLVSAASP